MNYARNINYFLLGILLLYLITGFRIYPITANFQSPAPRLLLEQAFVNPTEGQFTLEYGLACLEPAQISLFDDAGKRIAKIDTLGDSYSGKIQLMAENPGIYLAVLEQGKKRVFLYVLNTEVD